MKTFAQHIAEGGNIKVGDAQASPFRVTPENRDSRAKDIHHSMGELNKSFHAEHGHHLFAGGKAHYAGSSMHLMDKDISAASFAKHKPSVGDVDVHVPHEHGDKLHAHLKPGAKFGKYTVAGTKKHGADISAVMKHDNGETHQFDFVKGKFGKHEQSFLHSSHWDDVTKGVKGLHHKMLLNAAGGEKHKFSISGGLKSRTDDKDAGHQHPKKISRTLFGKDADHEKIHSFHGVADLIKDHIPEKHHQEIYDKFKSSVKTNPNDHTKAVAHLKKVLGAKDEVNEGFSLFKKKAYAPLTDEHKVHIKKHFKNASFDGHNGTAYHENKELKFRNEDGKLKASVSHYRSRKDALGLTSGSPVGSIDKPAHDDKAMAALREEAEHHTSVIPLVGFSPISHMGHAHDLGGALKKLPGKKHVGISNKADLFSPEERSHIMKKQWGQKDVNHHFTKSGGDTIGHAYHSLPKDGKKHLHILVGGDRKEFAHGLKKSLEAGKIPEMNGHKWDSIHIHTPEDSDRAHGMSGTAMRSSAVTDDHETFHKHVGHMFSKDEAKSMQSKIKAGIISKKIKLKR